MSTTETNYPAFLTASDIKHIEGTANTDSCTDAVDIAEEILNTASNNYNKQYNLLTCKVYHGMNKKQVFNHCKNVVSKAYKAYEEFSGEPDLSVSRCKRIAVYLYMERVTEYTFRVYGK
jgi:hypothetical protein